MKYESNHTHWAIQLNLERNPQINIILLDTQHPPTNLIGCADANTQNGNRSVEIGVINYVNLHLY